MALPFEELDLSSWEICLEIIYSRTRSFWLHIHNRDPAYTRYAFFSEIKGKIGRAGRTSVKQLFSLTPSSADSGKAESKELHEKSALRNRFIVMQSCVLFLYMFDDFKLSFFVIGSHLYSHAIPTAMSYVCEALQLTMSRRFFSDWKKKEFLRSTRYIF